jgi:hypothetical protein
MESNLNKFLGNSFCLGMTHFDIEPILKYVHVLTGNPVKMRFPAETKVPLLPPCHALDKLESAFCWENDSLGFSKNLKYDSVLQSNCN